MSRRTAELSLNALSVALRLAAPRRNGLQLPDDWKIAFAELAHIAHAPGRTEQVPVPVPVTPLPEEVDVPTAAERLGVSRRAIQARCARGTLPARRVGRSWLVRLENAHGN